MRSASPRTTTLCHAPPSRISSTCKQTREKLRDWASANPNARVASFAETAAFGDVVVLAVKGSVASEALNLAGHENLSGKIILDATNPIADAPPTNGVLPFFTDFNGSLMERMQGEFTDARFVKAFNSVGAPAMVNPQFKGVRRPCSSAAMTILQKRA